MLEARDGARLAREASARFIGAAQVRVHHLDRDPAIEPRVAGAVHRRHAAVANFVADFVTFDARKHELVACPIVATAALQHLG